MISYLNLILHNHPSLFFYDPDYTDNIFIVDEKNNTHIIWYYETQSPQKPPMIIKRYSNNVL